MVIFSIYTSWMLVLIYGWLISSSNNVASSGKINSLTVLIPFRNEKDNIPLLIKSLSELQYRAEAVEFIFINDHSVDNSVETLLLGLEHFAFPHKLISLEENHLGKKRAIEAGVIAATHSVIVTTDVDCVHSRNWLQEINRLMDSESEFIIGPVINKKQPGLLSNLQQIESLLLAGITVGSAKLKKPLLCSGANLSYTKSLFNKLQPYENNYNTLSGDDMFFLEKTNRNKDCCVEINAKSIVATEGAKSFAEMLSRSVRWASKSSKLKMSLSTVFGAIVLITNCSILFMIVLMILDSDSIVFLIKLCAIKTIVDVLFLVLLANRYNRYQTIIYFPVMVVFYPFYLFIVYLSTVFSSPVWKGR
jgi:cellulose synthase/poly-beta-1,6-N-acetylglucosamine synthase-like glycosyltransferase